LRRAPFTRSPDGRYFHGMKAVLIRRYGGPEVLEVADVPAPTPKSGEVVVKVAATSVNPVDWLVRDGKAKSFVRVTFPVILGCDLAGEVVALGAGATRFKLGDPVFAMMAHDWGAHAELVALREDLVMAKPAKLSMVEAASLPVVSMTALLGLRGRAGVQPGERVLVNGASGGVGLAAIQIAKALGAEVTAVSSSANFDLVKAHGADRVIDYKTTDFTTQAEAYDVILDLVGNHPWSECSRVLHGRRVHVTTMPGVGTFIRQFVNPVCRTKVFGIVTTGAGEPLDYLRSLVDGGKLVPTIDRVFPFSEVAAAQEYSKSGRAKGKIVLEL
jgi:NADPH:quinone reductase-like Zn-dependent oxidoreductase